MKPSFFLIFLVWALSLPLLAACGGQEGSMPDEAVEAGLFLDVTTVSRSADGTASLSDNETMTSVRILVLHEDGTVEHNRHFTLDDSEREHKRILLKVSTGERKKIFLFANEESVASVEGTANDGISLSDFFDRFSEDDPNFKSEVDGLYFAPDYSDGKPIPMSSMYEIEMGNERVEKTLHLVRVATKFTINFFNLRDEEVKIENFSIERHADKNFLMARVNDSEQNRQLFGEGKTWIDWLMQVVATSSDSETDDAWLKDYELPSQARTDCIFSHPGVTVGTPSADAGNPGNVKPGLADVTPVFFLPESKNLKPGATDGEQEYTMTVRVEGKEDPFIFKLPDLKALFRNTHVIVNITMTQKNAFKVSVKKWRTLNYEYEY